MLDAVADWGGDVTVPLLLGLVAVGLTWRPGWGRAAAIGGSTIVALVVLRSRVPAVLDALTDHPLWFTGAALAAGAVAAVTIARLLADGRGPEGVVLAGVGLGAAAAALPDVEALLGVAALWLPWLLAPPDQGRTGPHRLVDGVAAAAVATAVVLALVDGARGRPGSILIAPMVVGPSALALLLRRPSRPAVVVRAIAAGTIGLLVARHAGLGAGTARPLIGSLLGLLGLVLVTVLAVRTPRGHRG